MRNISRLIRKKRVRARRDRSRLTVLPGVASPELGNARDIYVYLPARYLRTAERYPVVYMHDGQNLFDPGLSFAGSWRVDRTLARMSRKGGGAIVVGIPNLGRERLREYSPFAFDGLTDPAGDRYIDFILHTLKPLIDARFRTLAGREHLAIAGSSLGGLISLYAFFRYPYAFGAAAVLSPSVWLADAAILDLVTAAPFVPGRVYLDIGAMEGGPTVGLARKLRDLLLLKGYRPGHDLLWVEDPRGRHHEAFWGRRFRRALPFLLRLDHTA